MANTKVTGDLIAQGAIHSINLADGSVTATKLHNISTDHISEGTNLFYTDARVSTYLTTNNYVTTTEIANTANWDEAYSWGNHALVGYLTSFTETDPIFTASDAFAITSTQITNWDTAYGWGDHSTVGYLTSFTETDPIYSASSWFSTTNNASNWDTAYSWGNHATQSYATETYVNTAVANLVDSAPTTLDTLNELAAALGDDPNFATTVSTSIGTKWTQDNTKISNWDTAYSWGNHASAGYLTSFTETDPTVPSHVKSITTTNISNWNAAYGWGNHASAGYQSASTAITTSNIASQSVSYANTSGNANSLQGRVIGSSTDNIAYLGSTRNLVINNPENYSGEIRLGAAWNYGGVYASNTLTMASSSSINFVISNNVYATLNTDYFTHNSDIRTPIFYDSNNTVYYIDPNGVTNLGGTNDFPFRVTKTSGVNSGCALFTNQYGDNSWGIVSEFRIGSGSGTDRPSILFSTGYNNNTWSIGYGFTDDNFRIKIDHGWRNQAWGTQRMVMDRSGNVTFSGDVTAYSDERIKKDVKTIENALEKVNSMRGVTYKLKENNKEGIGVIAQEIEKIIPQVVSETPSDDGEAFNVKNVAYGNIVGVLIEAIKELSNKVEELENKLNGTN